MYIIIMGRKVFEIIPQPRRKAALSIASEDSSFRNTFVIFELVDMGGKSILVRIAY